MEDKPKRIYLSGENGKGKCTIIDSEDLELLSKYSWNFGYHGYAVTTINKKFYNLHQLLFKIPKGKMIDHINHNKLDNRKSNLRICTNAQNQWNQKKKLNKISKYKGVTFAKARNKWQVSFIHYKKIIWGGRFDSEKKAAQRYNELVGKFRGEFALLNKI